MKIEDSEITKFNNSLTEIFLNLLEGSLKMHEADKSAGNLPENLFRCLIRTYNLMNSETASDDLIVEEELDGISILDKYIFKETTVFRSQYYK